MITVHTLQEPNDWAGDILITQNYKTYSKYKIILKITRYIFKLQQQRDKKWDSDINKHLTYASPKHSTPTLRRR